MTETVQLRKFKMQPKPSLPNCKLCPFQGAWCKEVNLRHRETGTPLCPLWFTVTQFLIGKGILKGITRAPSQIPIKGEEARIIMETLRKQRLQKIQGIGS